MYKREGKGARLRGDKREGINMKIYTFFQVSDLDAEIKLYPCGYFHADSAEVAGEKLKEQIQRSWEGISKNEWLRDYREIILEGVWVLEGDYKDSFAFKDKDKLGMVMVRDSSILN